jgi:hypothetical protein
MIRGRLRRLRGAEGQEENQFVEIDPSELAGLFAAPGWLRDGGFTAWLLVGVVVLLAGVVWLLTLTAVIFIPLVVACVIAAVAVQLVDWLNRHGLPRALGALLVLQQIVQPVAYGAALGLHPLAVLVLTIAGGALLGTIVADPRGPIASAIVRISADLGRARAEGAT